jgi:hypothetical protein
MITPRLAAQDFSLQVARADKYFRDGILPTWLTPGEGPITGGMKGAFSFGLGASASYDSNVFLSETDAQSDLVLGFSPSISYVTDPEGGAPLSLRAYYAPSLNYYLDDSDLGRWNQAGGVSMDLEGAKTTISGFANFRQYSGADRFSGGYVETEVFNFGLQASYRIAPRTVLVGGVTASTSDYATAGQVGSDIYGANFGFLWAASERFRLGSSLNGSQAESSNSGTRRSVALTFDCDYVVTEKINLNASIGPDYYEDSGAGGGSGVDLFLRFSANYMINELWSWANSIDYYTIPSPAVADYAVQDLQFSSSLSRRLNYGRIDGGVGLALSNYEATGLTTTTVGNDTCWRVFLNYQRPFASDRLTFSSTVSYSECDGDANWSRWLVTVGVSAYF